MRRVLYIQAIEAVLRSTLWQRGIPCPPLSKILLFLLLKIMPLMTPSLTRNTPWGSETAPNLCRPRGVLAENLLQKTAPRDGCGTRDTENGGSCRGQIVGGGPGGEHGCVLAGCAWPPGPLPPPAPLLRLPSLLGGWALERHQSLDSALPKALPQFQTRMLVSFHFCGFFLFFLIVPVSKSVFQHLFCDQSLCRGSHGSLVDPGFLETLEDPGGCHHFCAFLQRAGHPPKTKGWFFTLLSTAKEASDAPAHRLRPPHLLARPHRHPLAPLGIIFPHPLTC